MASEDRLRVTVRGSAILDASSSLARSEPPGDAFGGGKQQQHWRLADALSRQLSDEDFLLSSNSLNALETYLEQSARDLVFWVGAGVSTAGATGLPGSGALIRTLLAAGLRHATKLSDFIYQQIHGHLSDAAAQLGFEETLDQLWFIHEPAIPHLFQQFLMLEETSHSNNMHLALAHWLALGGTVITTNYDRLIERAAPSPVSVRFRDMPPRHFVEWQSDLVKGGVLFKLHGSLEEENTCLGALEQVRTELTGPRARLVKEVVSKRPMCVIGWSGRDPDIPPVVLRALQNRPADLPLIWVHWHGEPPGSINLEQACSSIPLPLRRIAQQFPVSIDAETLGKALLKGWNVPALSLPPQSTKDPDLDVLFAECSSSGASRFVGIALRQAGRDFDIPAEVILQHTRRQATTRAELVATIQEHAHVAFARGTFRDHCRGRLLLSSAGRLAPQDPDVCFGLVSMTFAIRPLLAWTLPRLLRQYERSIVRMRNSGESLERVHIHEAQLALYRGRIREWLLGAISARTGIGKRWILEPYDRAHTLIYRARDAAVHSRIDLLMYRALAYAHLGECGKAAADVPEIARLVSILSDRGVHSHWQDRLQELHHKCPEIL
jgi:NAD-dependent SIR2 family protein deacetylase